MVQEVIFRTCEEFARTYQEKIQSYPQLEEKFEEFQQFKAQNPTQSYGGSDTPFVSGGPLARAVPKLKHAHLTQDISVLYTLSGRPATFYLYGIYTHKESGTGTPQNIKVQKSLGKRLSNQQFK